MNSTNTIFVTSSTKKMYDFSNPQKSRKMAESIDPLALKVGLWAKKHDFWGPFWHGFSDFFKNGKSVK